MAIVFIAAASSLPTLTLQDPLLTPGAADSAVTQANIAMTICVAGYTSSVRHVTTATKRAVVKSYRSAHPDWPDGPYEIDHLVSIELGGSNDASNLFPQPLAEAKLKDVVENHLHRSVCSGRMSLAEAQTVIRHWFEIVAPLESRE